MLNTSVSNNGMNEGGVYNEGLSPGRFPVVRTPGPGRHQATARKKWSTQDNICVTTCYYQSHPGVRRYRQWLHVFWKEKALFPVGVQSLCDQVRMIYKKDWLRQLQLKEKRRLLESGENNVEAQQEDQNWTGTGPTQQLTEQHIARNEVDEGRDEYNVELLINYNNIGTEEK